MLVFAHPPSLIDKFSGEGKNGHPLLIWRSHRTARRAGRRAPSQLTRCSVSESLRPRQPAEKGGSSWRPRRAEFSNPQKRLARWKFCLSGVPIWTSKFYPAMGLSLRRWRFD
jgi:hypothetical protein